MSTSWEAENGHIVLVATKFFDVVVHPLKQKHLVVETQVYDAFFQSEFWREEAKSSNSRQKLIMIRKVEIRAHL